MKRSRGRGRRQQNPVNRSYDSNGPDVRVRGTASQVFEKYQALARDAMSAGDRVMAENYQQHAEHYYRILQSFQPQPSENENADAANGAGEETAQSAESNGAAGEENGKSGEPLVWCAKMKKPRAAKKHRNRVVAVRSVKTQSQIRIR